MTTKLAWIPLLAGLLAGCGERFEWNQKITVTVETPQGDISGSSVSSVLWTEGSNWSTGWNLYDKGEAVVVDIGRQPILFALLRHDDVMVGKDRLDWQHRHSNFEWLGSVGPASIAGLKGRPLRKDLFAEVAGKSGRASGIVTIPPYQYPLLVAFKDINDPKSAFEVDPADLAGVFGPGYRLKSITLEVTDEDRTAGKVQGILKWLPNIQGSFGGPSGLSASSKKIFAHFINPVSFTTEVKR